TPSVHVHWLRCYVLPPPLLPPCPTLFPYTTLFRSMVVPSRDRPPSASTVGTTTRLAATTPASGATPGRRAAAVSSRRSSPREARSEEHTSELQSRFDLVCRLLLEKKKN